MNHVYRLVWNHVACVWQAVAECAKGQGKGRQGRRRTHQRRPAEAEFSLKPLLAALSLISAAAWAGPQGGQVVAGNATIQQSGATTTINQGSNRAAIDWNSFSVGKAESVRFNQPNSSSVTLNRVTGTESSRILGNLSANGQVFILNPNGVLFGKDAQVNVGGLVASSRNMSNADFMAGNYQLTGSGTGSVINNGTITVPEGGTIALIAPIVQNTGTLNAPQGSVLLAAADAVTLKLQDGSLVGYTLDKGSLQALVDNGGLIHADGGLVVLTAKGLDALSKASINHSGIIEAQTVANKNGVVELLGDMQTGEIKLSGKIDASAPNGGDGGFVETSAAKVRILDGHQVSTLAAKGKTGTWLIDPNDYTIAASGGDITGSQLSSVLADTSVTLRSSNGATAGNGDINVNDAVSWSANTLTLTAARDININAVMTASGSSKLVMNTGTANGSDSAVSGGTVRVGFAPGEANGFAGRVDFPGRSGSGFLTINGQDYTVINSLGAEGSTTGTDLQGMQGNLSGYYALGGNIDASATSGWNSGAGFKPVGDATGGAFVGVFDGLGHTINALNVNRRYQRDIGLFGYTTLTATVRNVGLLLDSVLGNTYVGGLVGYNQGSTISNAYATGSVAGASYHVGGLVGDNEGTISNAYATGSVWSTYHVGGLVGSNDGTISNAYATGSVAGNRVVGGLVGYNQGSTISNAYATGSVSIPFNGSDAGGLVGYNCSNSTISNAYATGGVSGSSNVSDVGGLVGYNQGSTISKAYATGGVSGGYEVGGLVGYNQGGTISNAYATGGVSGGTYAGGLVGLNNAGSTISNAYATGSVSGGSYVGGLLGGSNGTISNAYATGSVSGGSYVGGLVGFSNDLISNAYATGNVSGGSYYVGGLAGFVHGTISSSFWGTQTSGQATSAGGVGKTTAEMQQQATFSGWDFVSTWRIYEGQSTPVLRAFQRQVVVTANNESKTYDATAYSGGNGVSYSDVSAPIVGTVAYGGDSQGAVNAGEYTISVSGLSLNRTTQQDYQNWSGIVFKDGKLLINRASLNLVAVQGERTYDGTPYAYAKDVTALTGVFAGDSVQVVSGTGELDGKNAGEHNLVSVGTLTLGGAAAGNYQLTSTGSKWTILKRPLTIVANDSAKTYGEIDPDFTYFIANGSLVSGDVLSGKLSRVAGENVIDGGYAIQLGTLSAGNNYAITFNKNLSHLAINPRPKNNSGSDPNNSDDYVTIIGSISFSTDSIVYIYRPDGTMRAARNGDAIITGELIRVEKTDSLDNWVLLYWDDGSTTRLGGGSTLLVQNAPDNVGDTGHDEGLWSSTIRWLIGDSYFETKLPKNDIVAGVRG